LISPYWATRGKWWRNGNCWMNLSYRQLGLLLWLTPYRISAVLGPLLIGYGYFPAKWFWWPGEWFAIRVIPVMGLGLCVSLNYWQLTFSLGLGLFGLKIDLGRVWTIPEWRGRDVAPFRIQL
jgi:hypothetical protein